MKTATHKTMQIEDFERFYACLHKQHPEIMGAEWNAQKRILKVFYEDGAIELTEEELKNLKLKSSLTLIRKVPKLDVTGATIVSATSDKIIIELDEENQNLRKFIKAQFPDFEEVIP